MFRFISRCFTTSGANVSDASSSQEAGTVSTGNVARSIISVESSVRDLSVSMVPMPDVDQLDLAKKKSNG